MPARALRESVLLPDCPRPTRGFAAVPYSRDARAWVGVAAGAIATAAVDVATIVAEVDAATIVVGAGVA